MVELGQCSYWKPPLKIFTCRQQSFPVDFLSVSFLAQEHSPNSATISEELHKILIISVSKDATFIFKASVKLIVEF